jgi:hypothetical protein
MQLVFLSINMFLALLRMSLSQAIVDELVEVTSLLENETWRKQSEFLINFFQKATKEKSDYRQTIRHILYAVSKILR